MVSLTIDEREVEIEEGSTILEAAQKAGILIPTFCYNRNLLPFGACRLCVVEVEQMKGRFVPSCSTPATNGMVVHTNTPEIRNARKTLLELLLVHHPLDCPVCDKGGECQLQNLAYEYEVTGNRFQDKKFEYPVDYYSPLVERNTNRCVLCGMCARVCDEVVGVSAISFVNRGFSTVIGTNFERVLNCEFCGECVNICPVGALTDKLFKYKARSWELEKVNTICSYCSTGCTLTLGVKGNRIYRIIGDDTIGVTKGSLCSKGRFGYQYITSPERMNSPLVKGEDGELVRATWEEALEKVAQGFKEVKLKHGSESIGGICSGRLTNEEVYLFQKLMRAALGTNNIDHAGGFSYSGLLKGFKSSLGYAANDITLTDVRRADVIFIIRSDLSETHPVVGYQVNMAVKRDESRLIVASNKTIKLNILAAISLIHKPNREIALLNGLIQTIISEDLYDREFVSSSTEGFEQLKAQVARYSGDYLEKITGVKEDKIREAARILSQGKRVCILLSSGLGIISDDEKLAQAAANLALLIGMVGREGSGIGFLGEKCNSQGTLDMGALPHLLPGFKEVSDEKGRNTFEEAWKASIPSQPGKSAFEMLTAAEKGEINALYLVGENPVVAYPDATQTRRALESLDFLVVQDLFLTPTAKCADVVLPVASFAEKSGTYTNFERRIQMLNCGLNRLEGVKTDLEIFKELSHKMGYEMTASMPEEVMREISALVPLYAGINYSQISEGGIKWGSPDGGKESSLYDKGFSKVKARFVPVDIDDAVQELDREYPLLLTTGSVLFHSGSLSSKSPELNQVSPGGWMAMNPEDAGNYQLTDGQSVLLRSPRGEITVKVKINKKQTKGTVFVPYHFESQPVNTLTSKDLHPTFVEIRKA